MNGFYMIIFTVLVLAHIVTSHECQIKNGKEANLEDDSCESFWICKNYEKVKLRKCPDGGQIDFKDNECRPNEEVWCQWQHKQLEKSRSSKLRRERAKLPMDSVTTHGRMHEDMSNENYHDRDDSDSSSSGSSDSSDSSSSSSSSEHHPKDEVEYVEYDNYNDDGGMDADFYHDIEQWTYVCQNEWGHEPNLDDHLCKSYWKCEHYKGSLVQCKHGKRYDYHAQACRPRRHVQCDEQHRNHVNNKPKHKVEVKKNPDGSLTLIHHYYYKTERD